MSETAMAAAFGGGKGSGDDNPDDWNKKGKAAAMKVSDSSSTSIGEPSEDDDDEQEDQAEIKNSSLDCMDALEAALPMKRGLSTSYTGKSKSFSNLSDLGIENVKDIAKKEPLPNKRRRLLISYDKYPIFSRSFSTPLMIPTVDHEDEDDNKNDQDEESKKVGYEAGDEKEEEKRDEK